MRRRPRVAVFTKVASVTFNANASARSQVKPERIGFLKIQRAALFCQILGNFGVGFDETLPSTGSTIFV